MASVAPAPTPAYSTTLCTTLPSEAAPAPRDLSVKKQKANNYCLRVIPTVTHHIYSDIVSDIPFGSIYGMYMQIYIYIYIIYQDRPMIHLFVYRFYFARAVDFRSFAKNCSFAEKMLEGVHSFLIVSWICYSF